MNTLKNSKIMILLSILFSVGLTIYATVVIIKYPLIGMKVEQESGKWIVDEIHGEGWASNQPIEKGDIIGLIDKKKVNEHSTVTLFDRIEKVESITLLTRDDKLEHYTVSYENANKNQILLVLIPLIFNAVMILLSLFLYITVKIKRDVIILIYFLWSIGLCYLGAFLSARGDLFSWCLTGVALPSSIVLLIHFLKEYFQEYNTIFIKATTLKKVYIVNLIIILGVFIDQGSFRVLDTKKIELIYFSLLILLLITYLMRFFIGQSDIRSKVVMKILGLTVFIAFGPFVFFYATPSVIFGEVLMSAEVASTFLMVIPIALVYLLLAEKLFDIEFILNRFRYYSLLAFPFSIIITLLVSYVARFELSTLEIILVLFLAFITTVFLLYIKEYLDYKFSHHLFSSKGDFEMSLYTFFQKTKHEMKVSSLVSNIELEIKNVLGVKDVFYSEVYTENAGKSWSIKNEREDSIDHSQRVQKIDWTQSHIGSLLEISDGFGIVIGGDSSERRVIFFGVKDTKTNLNIQERKWLETLAYFSSILLENFELIENLFDKIENYKVEGEHPPWLSRLLFSLAEKERTNLSIDLHDSVLQDQLQMLREVEQVIKKVDHVELQQDLLELKERMLDNIHLVRETCNELQPPFLSEIGVIQSIQNLIDQTNLRCSFTLVSELDVSIRWLDKEVELTLYRIVQELLNNAMEHSEAINVCLKIEKNDSGIVLMYKDDGIGFNMGDLQNSFNTMGLFGIQERVRSIGGSVQINAAVGEGMTAHIKVKGGNINDQYISSR